MLKFEGMDVLLWKVQDCLSGPGPNARRIGIAEGGERNTLDLLYVLKGAGVIGLIDDDILPSKSGLNDVVYIFDIDKEKFKEFKETYRKENDIKISPPKYDPKRMVIAYRGRDLSVKPGSRMAMLCKYMFSQKIGIPVSWDVLYEEMMELSPRDKEKERKQIYDTIRTTNKGFKTTFGENLFRWSGNSVARLL